MRLRHRLEAVVAAGERSDDLRLPALPPSWAIDLVIGEELTLRLLAREGRFRVEQGGESTGPVPSVHLSADTLSDILDGTSTPTQAWVQGRLYFSGLPVGHFTDPSATTLFQLLRCGLGRRLPPRRHTVPAMP